MDHVEPDPCFNLAGKQDGSVPMSSQIEHEWNPSGNITVFDSEVLTQPRPNGYATVICFSFGHTKKTHNYC